MTGANELADEPHPSCTLGYMTPLRRSNARKRRFQEGEYRSTKLRRSLHAVER